MSLTDEIYAELMDSLKRGLDWQQFLAKHSASKGPLYNAIGRFFNNVEPKVRALSEVQRELDSLDQKIKEAEGTLVRLEERKSSLNEQIETLETKVAEKSEFIKQLRDLEKLGFNIEKLRQLQDALGEIGAKYGLEAKESVAKFFAELKDYDAKTGFEAEIQRLETITETKKLEAERWQAEEEMLKRKYDNLKEDIAAVHYLRTRNIKPGQLVVWHRTLSQFETVKQFDEHLRQYGNITQLLNAKKEEAQSYELRLAKAQSQVQTLEKERGKIEAEIESLRITGVKQLEAMTEASEKQLKVLAASEMREARAIGQEIRSELDKLLEKAVRLGEELERSKQELQKYERVKNVLESHGTAAEEVNEPISK